MQTKDILKLIPPDELHWSKIDNKFVLFSNEETHNILLQCIKIGKVEELQIMPILRQLENIKTGAILLNRFLKGGIEFDIGENEELLWRTKNE